MAKATLFVCNKCKKVYCCWTDEARYCLNCAIDDICLYKNKMINLKENFAWLWGVCDKCDKHK